MNTAQRKSAAKFLYDVAKIVIAIAVIGNTFSKDLLNAVAIIAGIFVSGFLFLFAHHLERRVEDDS